MPDPDPISDALLRHTAGDIGKGYLRQLLLQLARLTGAGQAVLTQRAPGLQQQLQVLYASPGFSDGHYALAGTPCAQVIASAAPLCIAGNLKQQFSAMADTPWQSFIAWPLLDQRGQCLGHLALFDQREQAFADSLLAAVQPFVRRAAAELQQLQQHQQQAQQQHWQMMHSDILRQNAQGKPLQVLMQSVVSQIEYILPDWRCSVLVLDEERKLQPMAGPSLPQDYQDLLRGLTPGPMAGSCGAAVWHGRRVIAENLQQHPNWAEYRDIAARFELGSCWSEPLTDSKGKVHGSFAIYQRKPAIPSPQAITIMEDTARLLALLLENHQAHRLLESRRQWYGAILQNAADALAIIDMDGHFLEASDSMCRMLNVSAETLATLRLWQVERNLDEERARMQLAAIGPQAQTFETVYLTAEHKAVEVEVCARRLELDGKPVVWASSRDIGQRKAMQRVLERQATTDALTGLFNRQTLLARLEVMLQLARVQLAPLSVLMLDLDHFKQINDRHGHQAGDMVLSELGETLREAIRESDAAGRIGGEEFCLLLPGTLLPDAEDLAARIVDDVSEMRIYSGHHILAMTCSIGIASLQPHDDCRALLARADAALYQAKAAGRNCACSQPAAP